MVMFSNKKFWISINLSYFIKGEERMDFGNYLWFFEILEDVWILYVYYVFVNKELFF